MKPGRRRAIALPALLLGLAAYAILVVTLADHVPQHWALEALYFSVAGILWVWPAARLVRWMHARD